ncbi:MAG TPA: hypothetical protein VND19_11655 [Acetobacteraceae bacterium]|nr:hypothetical protein [Acetobacteraceae bacterium]
MLNIRGDQMEVFRRIALDRFVKRMNAFLSANFPESKATGDTAWIERELVAARRFGLSRQNDLRDFLSLGMVYGEGFIDRPEHRWMAACLSDPTVPDPHQRMQRLYAAAILRLEQAAASEAARAAFDRACPPYGDQA